jgi:MraZ protein
LIELANLSKYITIIGVGDKIEIWSKENFDKYEKKFENLYESIAEKLENE